MRPAFIWLLVIAGQLLPDPSMAVEPPTLARLSLWMQESRREELVTAYEAELLPLLVRRGLVPSEHLASTRSGVFSGLFTLDSTTGWMEDARSLFAEDDSVRAVLRSLGARFGEGDIDWGRRIPGEGSIRLRFSIYTAPVNAGRSVSAGKGSRPWQTYDMTDGLAGAFVGSLAQDHEGAVWMGAFAAGANAYGANRFDGRNWSTFTRDRELSRNQVEVIYVDPLGRIWIGYSGGGGLTCFDGQRWQTYTMEDGLPSNNVDAIFQDRQGLLWVGTWDGGVAQYDGEHWRVFTTEDGLPSNRVMAIVQDNDGALWFGTNLGVSRFDGDHWTTFSAANGLTGGDYITAILRDAAGMIWLGRDGLNHFDGHSWTGITPDGGPLSVLGIAEDAANRIWIANTGGVTSFDEGSWTSFTSEDGLSTDDAIALLNDREDNLWVGTFGGGVSRLDKTLTTYRTADGLVEQNAFRVFEDRDGVLWVGTDHSGISRYDGFSWTTFDHNDGLPSSAIRSILQDRDGNLWFGTHAGVSRYDGHRWTNFGLDDGMSGPMVYASLQDHDGALWFGANGANRFDGKSWTVLAKQDGLVHNRIWSMLQDHDGVYWFGTARGLSRYDGAIWTTLLEGRSVASITQDPEGMLWFGTSLGLSRFDGDTWTSFTSKDGLAVGIVEALYAAPGGPLWIGTQGGGISRYDGETFQPLTREDGLGSNTVWSIVPGHEGQIWIATASGVTRYDAPPPAPPGIRVTAIVADRRYVDATAVSIPSTVSLTAFEFAGFSYKTRPGGMAYRYRLVGNDSQWQTTRAERVEYVDLAVGEYTFEVVAIDRDLAHSGTPATVSLEIVYQPLSSALQIAQVELQDLFASYYRTYTDQSVGTVTIANTHPRPTEATLRFFLPELMGRPFEQVLALESNEEIQVPLFASLRPEILDIDGELSLQADVSVSFYADEQTISVQESHEMLIHGRGALRWDDVGRAAAFINPTSQAVSGFARPLLVAFEEESQQLGRPGHNLLQAMVLFEGIKAQGVRYVVDANTPYASVAADASAIDHVQSAAQVLQGQSGDCDDLTSLYCSLLESAGIATALVDYPGHVFLLFDTGVTRWEAYQLPVDPRLCVLRDDRLWIPLEITRLDGSFHEAWRTGADELARLPAMGQRRLIVTTATAWKDYPPVAGPGRVTVAPPERGAIAGALEAERVVLKGMIDEQIERAYLDAMRAGDADSDLRTRLLRVYVALRRYDDAISAALDFLIDDRGDEAATHNHLGIAYFLKGEVKQAAYHFQQAVDVDPQDEGMRRNLGQALWTLGRTDQAIPDELLATATAVPLKGDVAQLDGSSFYWVEPEQGP
jgi:ligand-binding sensor domain-containing protein